jgi:small conductance mechanosensitive channel
MLEPIEIFGVDNFTDQAMVIKARFKTLPSQQYKVGREFRRRLKRAFDAAGVDLSPAARASAAATGRSITQSL